MIQKVVLTITATEKISAEPLVFLFLSVPTQPLTLSLLSVPTQPLSVSITQCAHTATGKKISAEPLVFYSSLSAPTQPLEK